MNAPFLAAALRAVNHALEPLCLVVRTYAEERRRALTDAEIVHGYWLAAHRARAALKEARADLEHVRREQRDAAAEVGRLRRHLRELDGLFVGHSPETKGARRILDVALGRDAERAA